MHQGDVFVKSVVGVTGHITRVRAFDCADGVREAIPDRFALTVLVPRAFDLIGSSGRAPIKI
jgi:hypothetical protein